MSSGKQARQRRRMVKAMAAAGLETGLAEQLYDNQIEPQLRAEELQAEGRDIQTDFVNIRPDAEGFEVTCLTLAVADQVRCARPSAGSA